MADYYWKGGVDTESQTAGNWVTTSEGSTAHTTIPGSDDDLFFDVTATRNCVFTSDTVTYNSMEIGEEFAHYITINDTTITITKDSGSSYANAGQLIISGAKKIICDTPSTFIFTSSTNGAGVEYGSNSEIDEKLGVFYNDESRQQMTFHFNYGTLTTLVLGEGVYPNIQLTNAKFSPVTSTVSNQYEEVKMLGFTVYSSSSVEPHTSISSTDLTKIYRIEGDIVCSSNTFKWGKSILKLAPVTAGEPFPYDGNIASFGTGTPKVFNAEYYDLRIIPLLNQSTNYFSVTAGAIISVNSFTVESSGRIYGPSTGSSAEVHTLKKPTVRGDWNFQRISDGVYRSITKKPLIDVPHGGTGLSAIGEAGQVLAVTTAGTGLEWSSTAGGGGVTVEEEGTPLATTANTLNFTGNGVVASGTGTTKTITITDTDTNTNQLTTFDIGVDTNTNATTISHGETLTFTGGTGISTETTADGTVTITNDSPNVFSGSIAATQVAYGSGTNAITGESDFTYDATNDLLAVDKVKSHIIIEVQNDTGSSIPKGQAVYVDAEGTHPSVAPALATNAAKMPSIGLAQEALATTGVGYVCVNGIITISSSVIDDTLSDPGDVGKTLYVSETTAGNLTITKPTSPNDLVQNVGKIADINGTNVKVIVSNIGRSNDVPNTISIEGDITTTTGDLTVSAGQASFTINDASNVPLRVEQDGDGKIAEFYGASNEVVHITKAGTINFNLSTAGGDSDEQILSYRDSGSTARNLLSIDSGTVVLHNRASNGDVEIRANSTTAGNLGEETVAKFEDTVINLYKDTIMGGTLTGDLTGNADTATTATNVVLTDNESTDEDNAIVFGAGGDVDGSTSIGLESDGDFTYNPSSGLVSAGMLTLTSTSSDQLKINYDGDDKFAIHVGTDRTKFRYANTSGTLKDVLMFKENGTGVPRVGINETDPDTMLHVGGNIKMESSGPILYVGTTASNSSQAELKLHGARNADGNPFGQIVFSNNDDSGTNTGTYNAAKIFAFNDGGDKGGGLQFQTVPAGSSTTLATALTIQEDTNIVTAGNLTVGGNLIVSGDSITVNAETITTEEAMLSLGIGQTATDADALDFGFYGTYDVSDTQKYRGLFADASDSGKFKLFKDLEAEPTTTVNVSGTGYAVGTLVANLEGNVTGNLTGSADSATVATRVVVTDNESTDESNALVFVADADVDGALDAALESDGDLTYNPSTGVVTATGFAGALTGDVTGNVSGTAATVTDATQSAITSVGTLTSLEISGDLTVDTSTLKVDSSNNRVGVGTTSPASLLHVGSTAYELESGAYLVNSQQRTAKMVIHADDSNTNWYSQDIGLALHNEDPTDNNWSPHIAFTTHEDDDGDPANANPVAVAAISATYNTRVANGWTKGDLVFFTNNAGTGNAERMRIDSAGNVGIGTTSPDSKLQIAAGNNPASAALMSSSSLAISSNDGNLDLLSYDDNTTVANNIAFKRFVNSADGALIHTFGISHWANTGSVGSNTGDRLAFNYGTNANPWSNTELLTIESGGNVGIGTTSPGSYKLVVEETTNPQLRLQNPTNAANGWDFRVGDTGSLIFKDDGTERVRFASNGNVGIGTASPGTSLHIIDAENVTLSVDSSHSIGSQISLDATATGGDEWRLISAADGASADAGAFGLYNIDTSAYRFVVKADGNVGIGTTSPGHKLHVTGPPDDSGDYAIYADEGTDQYVALVNRHSSNRATAIFYRNIHADYTAQPMVEMHNDHASDDQSVLKITQDGSGDAIAASVNDSDALEWVAELRNRPNPQAPTTFGAGIKLALSSGSGNELLKWVGVAAVKSPDLNYSRKVDAAFYTQTDASGGNDPTEKMRITGDGDVGIGTTSPSHKLEVNGSFAATTKSFDIEHPTKEGKRLHHGSLEGPEHGVYIRGKNNSGTIHLPDYWKGLVDKDSITVQLTAIGKPQELYVREIKNNRVRVAAKTRGTHLNYFYFIQAERKDVEKMVVEY